MPSRSRYLTPGDHHRELLVHGQRRSYLVHVPAEYDPDRGETEWPLVLALHGGRTNAELMVSFSGLNPVADEQRFLVVYPAGVGRSPQSLTWNAGRCCGDAAEGDSPDVGFLIELLDKLPRWLPYHPQRVYAAGISNGGMMAQRLAIEHAHRVAAIASVSGPLETPDASVRPSRPVPLVHFHGTADEFIRYTGGPGSQAFAPLPFRSVAETLAYWVAANGAEPSAREEPLPSQVDDGTAITRIAYAASAANAAPVVHYKIHGGGHTWPGQPPRPGSPLGVSTQNLDANRVIWEFFQTVELP